MQLATDDGVILHVEELGQGAPVVMLHGLLIGSMMTWYIHAAPRLAQRNHVILFDLRGHGKSERAARGYDVHTMSLDLECVLDRLVHAPAILIGHSYGALVALHLAIRRPDRVRKLALVEAPFSGVTELDDFLGKSPEQMLEALPLTLRPVISAPGRRGRRGRRFYEAMRFFAEETSLLQDLRLVGEVSDRELDAITCPVLAVYGTESSCRPGGARILARVRGANVVELPGGHFLPIESPRELSSVLERFADG
jgi:pimeloyl-ACP methyl ester carboxylesterase